MKDCIATVSVYGELKQKLTAIAAAGFKAIELFSGDVHDAPDAARSIRKWVEDLGLEILLFQPLRDIEGVNSQQFEVNLDRAKRCFEFMVEVGAPRLLICSNTLDALSDDERAADQLRQVAELAAAHGARVGYEALAWGNQVKTFDHAFRLVEMADHPSLGVVLDSFHTLVRPEDWASISGLPADKIEFVQLGDAPIVDVDYMTWRREYSTLPGNGELDVAGFASAVRRTGYKGALSIEVFNVQDRTPAPWRALEAMRSLRAIIACEDLAN